MKPKFVELELVLYLLCLVLLLGGVLALDLGGAIVFQARQDPTFIIYTILALFIMASIWVIAEMAKLIAEHGRVGKIIPRLGQFTAIELSPQEQRSIFGQVLIGLRIAHQQNPLHEIDYRAEISETVAAVDARHANIRFIARVAQYLGVIGTMLGLIIALGVLYRDLSVEQQNLQMQIVDAIKNSMSGMYAAYATSVAGLFLGSIVLTFGAMLLRNALDKYELRLLVICRRFIAPQLTAHLNTQEAEARTYDLLLQHVQGMLDQYRQLHQVTSRHAEAVEANNRQLQQLESHQAETLDQLKVLSRFMERVAVYASRVMGVPTGSGPGPTDKKPT